MKFDLSNFKKIHSDSGATTLLHPDGHQIRIEHASLRPQIKKQLDKIPLAMADGGDVEDPLPPQEDQPNASQMPSADPMAQVQAEQEPTQEQAPDASQAVIEKYKKLLLGNEPGIYKNNPDALQKAAEDRALNEMEVNAHHDQVEQSWAQEDAKQQAQQVANHNARAARFGLPQRPMPVSSQQASGVAVLPNAPGGAGSPQLTNVPVNAPQQPSQDPQMLANSGYADMLGQGLSQQEKGIQAEANAQSLQGKAEAIAAQNHMQAMKVAQDDFQKKYAALDQEREKVIKDIQDQHIDPNKYLHDMGTGQKIATGIGLILGGLGAGVTGGQNPVIEHLQQQMAMNVDTQKAELGKKHNLLSALNQQFGNLRDATSMMHVIQNDHLASQLQIAAGQSKDPMAQARAQQAIGQLKAQNAPMVAQIAARQALMGPAGSGVDPSLKIRMMVDAKEQPQAYKELQEAQAVTKSGGNLLAAFDQIAKTNTLGNRLSSPLQSSRQISALRDPILAALSKETAGRFTEADAGMLKTLFPAAGDTPQTLQLKRARMQQMVGEKMNFPVLSAYGIKPPEMRSLAKPMMSSPANYNKKAAQMPMQVNYAGPGK